MGSRVDLSKVLHEVLGNNNVYFQPPPSLKMKYPCIVYERVRINTRFADNKPYKLTDSYQLTYIDKNPDSLIPHKIAELPMCIFERHYVNDNLYHDVFRISN